MGDKIHHALYSIIFEDKSKYSGGYSYYDSKWLDIPCNKKIKRIFYKLPDGNYLTLGGYDKYYHMVEGTEDIMGKNKGKKKIEYVYIMGKLNNIVTSYRITLFQSENSRYKIGDIVRREFNIENKFVKGLNGQGWR